MAERRVDVTLGLCLRGAGVDAGAVVVALEELLSGATVFAGPQRAAFTVEAVEAFTCDWAPDA